jgi:hypothetical protein
MVNVGTRKLQLGTDIVKSLSRFIYAEIISIEPRRASVARKCNSISVESTLPPWYVFGLNLHYRAEMNIGAKIDRLLVDTSVFFTEVLLCTKFTIPTQDE